MTMTSGAEGLDLQTIGAQPKITINGTALTTDALAMLLSMEVETSVGRPDLCELRFIQAMDQAATPADDISASWAPGKIIKVEASSVVLFDGEITSVDFRGSTTSPTEVVLLAFDRRHRLYRHEVTKVFKQMTFKGIVADLIRLAGASVGDLSGLPTDTIPYYLHEGTPGDLIDRLCDQFGLYSLGQSGKVDVKKSSALTEVAGTLRPTTEMLDFRFRQTTSADRAKSEVRWWDPKTKKAMVGKGDRSAAIPAGVIDKADSAPSFKEQTLIHAAVASSVREADAIAVGALARNVDAGMQLDATCTFLPEMTAGKLVTIEAVPARFKGTYRLTAVRHRYDNVDGSRTVITCRGADDTTLPGLLQQAVLGGALPPLDPYVSVRPAVVVKVKSVAEEGAVADAGAEVMVKMPWLDSGGTDVESGWLRLVCVGGGNDRGLLVMPEVGDEVLVAFEGGDTRRGYVLGGLYNGQDKPPRVEAALTDGSSIHERVWRSREGHQIVLGDKKNEEYVQISTKDDGMVVRLDVKEKLIKITGEDVTIENTGKVTIKSTGEISVKSDGDLKMEAMNVSLKAKQKVTIEGGTQVSINGNAGAEVKGAKVDITAQGPATVKGNPIMLN